MSVQSELRSGCGSSQQKDFDLRRTAGQLKTEGLKLTLMFLLKNINPDTSGCLFHVVEYLSCFCFNQTHPDES